MPICFGKSSPTVERRSAGRLSARDRGNLAPRRALKQEQGIKAIIKSYNIPALSWEVQQ